MIIAIISTYEPYPTQIPKVFYPSPYALQPLRLNSLYSFN